MTLRGLQVDHEHTDDSCGGDSARVPTWRNSSEADVETGKSTITCTLPEAVTLLFQHVPQHARSRLASQMLPAWMAALKAHGQHMSKAIRHGTTYKWLRALPLERAVQVVEEQRLVVVAQLETEVTELRTALDEMAAVAAAGPPADGVHDVFIDD